MANRSRAAEIMLFPAGRSQLFDPPPTLAELRYRQPIQRLRYPDGQLGWLVTSHALVRAVLGNSRFSSRPPQESDPRQALNEGNMEISDPPQHTRLRRAHTAYFTLRNVDGYRARMEAIVAEQLDAIGRSAPPVDLVAEFTLPISSATICDWLGVQYGDREQFERVYALAIDPDADAEQQGASLEELHTYVRAVVDDKRAQPKDDLLSELIANGELTDEELVGDATALLMAAPNSSVMLALSVYALLNDRDWWEALRADPALLGGAIEDLLRLLTIFKTISTRTALEDVELDGITVKAGESVSVSLSAANRDPTRFADPDRFDPAREASDHVAFGYGRHTCLGQHLARLQLHVALAGLMRRFPTLRLAVPAEDIPMYSGETFVSGVHELPVTW